MSSKVGGTLTVVGDFILCYLEMLIMVCRVVSMLLTMLMFNFISRQDTVFVSVYMIGQLYFYCVPVKIR